jgi:UDP-glucose 4-epimerase
VAGEAYCFAYHRAYGVDARIARFFSVFGPGLRRLAIHDLIRKAERATDELEVLGDGTQVRDYLYIDDAVNALLTVARHGAPGEDYNIGSGVPVTALALARLIATAMGRPELRLRTTGASFSGDTPRWYADISKIRKLGFEPRMPFDEGLRRTVAWLTSWRG